MTTPENASHFPGGPGMRATVLVRPKDGILDPPGEAVLGSLRHLGFNVEQVRIGRVIDLELTASDAAAARAEVERMCEQLLANPLIESFDIELAE
jgi:phosphoribosylformylglycinamidine synthase PurS subunit